MTWTDSWAIPTEWTELRVLFMVLGSLYLSVVGFATVIHYKTLTIKPTRFLGVRDLAYLSKYCGLMIAFGVVRSSQVLLNCLYSQLPRDADHRRSALSSALANSEPFHTNLPVAVWVFKLIRPDAILGIEEALDTLGITLFFVLKCILLFAWAYLVRVIDAGGPDPVYFRRLVIVGAVLSSMLFLGLMTISAIFIYGVTSNENVLDGASLAGEAFTCTWSIALALGFSVFGFRAVRALNRAISSRMDDAAADALKRSAMLQTIAFVSFVSFALRGAVNLLLLITPFYDLYDSNAGVSCLVEFFFVEVLACQLILLGFWRQLAEQRRFLDEPLLAMKY